MPSTPLPIVPERSTVVVIDMQNDSLRPDSPRFIKRGHAMIGALARFLDDCRAAGVPITHIAHRHKADGSDFGRMGANLPNFASGDGRPKSLVEGTPGAEIVPELAPKPGEPVYWKHRFSGFTHPDLDRDLRARGIDTLIVTGVNTNGCCESLVRAAKDLDYRVIMVSDCNANSDMPDRGWGPVSSEESTRVTFTTVSMAYGEVMTAAQTVALIGAMAEPA